MKARIFYEYFKRLQEWVFLRQLSARLNLVQVRSSDDLGRGLYASTKIPAGTLLGIYPGRTLTRQEFQEREEFSIRAQRYAYYFSDDLVIDPTDLFGNLPDCAVPSLALVNEPPPGVRINVVPICTVSHVWYVTIAEIMTDEQLFTTYGPNFRRNYQTDLDAMRGAVELSVAEQEILRRVSEKYLWLRDGVKSLLIWIQK